MVRHKRVSLLVLAMSLVALGDSTPPQGKRVAHLIKPSHYNEIFPGKLLVKVNGAAQTSERPAMLADHQVSRIAEELGGASFEGGLHHGGWTLWHLPDGVDPKLAAAALAHDPDVIYAEPVNHVYALSLPVPNDADWSVIESRSTYVYDLGSSSSKSNQTTADFQRLWNLWDTSAVTDDTGSVSGGWATFPGVWYTAKTKPADCPIIAFIDTGVDMGHPDFINAGGTSTDIGKGGQLMTSLSAYFQNGAPVKGAAPTDLNGHGSHVAGLAIAAGNNGSYDGYGMIGIGYNSRGMILRVFDSSGNADDIDAAEAIYYAVNNGAAIINLSLGDTNYSQVFQDAVTYAWQKGALVVCAGNENGAGGGNLGPIYPAACSGALGVTANGPGEVSADDNYAGYGNYVGIAAPGGDLVTYSETEYALQYVWSTATRYDCELSEDTALFPPYTLDYTYLVGTSMACPHVSGAAGLFYGQNAMHQTDGWANLRAFQALEQSADGSGGAEYGGWEPTQGYGSLNVQSLTSYGKTPNPRAATVGDVTGIVYYGGTPTANVRVTATLVAAPHTQYQTTSFADGTYRFDAFKGGVYDVMAAPFGSKKTKRVQVTNGCDMPGIDFFCGPAVTDKTPPVIAKFGFVSGSANSLTFNQWAYDTETEIDSATVQIGTTAGASNILAQQILLPGSVSTKLTGFTLPAQYFATFTYTNGIGGVSHATREVEADTADAYVSDAAPNVGYLLSYLAVSTGAAGKNKVAYLTFNVANLNKTLIDGNLTLTGAASGSPVNVGVYATDESTWSQSTITWNKRPKIVGAAIADQTVGKNGTYTWNLSSLIQSAVNSKLKTITIALHCDTTSTTGASFNSLRAASLTPHVTADAHD